MSDILYTYKDNLYINLTNQCPCSCTFCIRSQQKGLGTAEDLWLDKDPTVEQVIQGFEQFPLKDFREVIFCGYGRALLRPGQHAGRQRLHSRQQQL